MHARVHDDLLWRCVRKCTLTKAAVVVLSGGLKLSELLYAPGFMSLIILDLSSNLLTESGQKFEGERVCQVVALLRGPLSDQRPFLCVAPLLSSRVSAGDCAARPPIGTGTESCAEQSVQQR